MLIELARVLAYPRITKRTGWAPERRDAFIESVASGAIWVSPGEHVSVSRDSADDRILEAAYAGSADYIVSGDTDLLVLGEFRGIPIVSPTTFLAILNTH